MAQADKTKHGLGLGRLTHNIDILFRSEKKKPTPEIQDLDLEDMLLEESDSPEPPSELPEKEKKDEDDYSVELQEAKDAFLRASGSKWIYKVSRKEEEILQGTASSRRKALREIRKTIGKDERGRQKKDSHNKEIKRLSSLLTDFSSMDQEQSENYIKHMKKRATRGRIRVEMLPGDYLLLYSREVARRGSLSSKKSSFIHHTEIWSPDTKGIVAKSEVYAEEISARKCRKQAKQELAEWIRSGKPEPQNSSSRGFHYP